MIAQDRSQGALETEKVLGDLLPLLQAVKPAELNATLTAVADRAAGPRRGARPDAGAARHLPEEVNPHDAAQLVNDLDKLGTGGDEYNEAAPDLVATLNNLQTSAHDVIDKQAALDSC